MKGAVDIAIHAACLHVRVLCGFFQGKDRREAGVGAFEQGAPLSLGSFGEQHRKLLALLRPEFGVRAAIKQGFGRLDTLHQLGKKLRFQWPDGDVAAVRTGVAAVMRGGA